MALLTVGQSGVAIFVNDRSVDEFAANWPPSVDAIHRLASVSGAANAAGKKGLAASQVLISTTDLPQRASRFSAERHHFPARLRPA